VKQSPPKKLEVSFTNNPCPDGSCNRNDIVTQSTGKETLSNLRGMREDELGVYINGTRLTVAVGVVNPQAQLFFRQRLLYTIQQIVDSIVVSIDLHQRNYELVRTAVIE